MNKQKRHKNGRYGAKTWRARLNNRNAIGHTLILCAVIWTVNVIELHNLPENKVVITNTTRWDVRADKSEAEAGAQAVDDESNTDVLDALKKTGDVTAPQSMPSSAIERLIRETFPEDPDTAVAIFRSESGLNPNAKGDIPLEYEYEGRIIGHSCGIAQIRVIPGRPDCETLKNPKKNLEFARGLYEKHGWYPWSNYKNGAYKKFL